MYVDSHAHLFAEDFRADLDAVLERARAAGVDRIVCPGTDAATSAEAVALAGRYEMIHACVGIHPHEASKATEESFAEIERLAAAGKVVAIGEIGLDYHYDFSPPDVQRGVFARQIDLAVKLDLPIVIHTREAEADTLRIVGEKVREHPEWRRRLSRDFDRYPPPRGVFHCFPGDPAMARQLIGWGFFVSLPGPVTFAEKPGKRNTMAEVARSIPPEHLLVETDCPWLAPVPLRGKRNEPANIPLIAEAIARLQHLSPADIGRATTFSAHKLFGIGEFPEPVVAYTLGNSLYLNITIRCNADCTFCDRKGEAVIKGHNLRIEREPSGGEVIAAVGDPKRYEEVVFCGYGEPTIRFDVLKEVARQLRAQGAKIRLNTNGHGSVINGRDIVPELAEAVDAVSISLNSTDPEEYGKLMRVDGPKMFAAMVDFAKKCVARGIRTTMTVVEMTGADSVKAREFVEKEIGAVYRERPYF